MVIQKKGERERGGGEWLIRAHTQNIPYLLTVTTQETRHMLVAQDRLYFFSKAERMTLF